MGEQVTLPKSCLCFQYATPCDGDDSCDNVDDITGGGALVPTDKDGKCVQAKYQIDSDGDY